MERVQELIDKLWKQHQQQDAPERLLHTVQLLQDTLSAMVQAGAAAPAGKVAVVLPPRRRAVVAEAAAAPPVPSFPVTPAEAPLQQEALLQHEPEVVMPPVAGEIQPAAPLEEALATAAASIPVREPYMLQKPLVTEAAPPVPVAPSPAPEPPAAEREIYHLHFDTTDEAPTLLQQYPAQQRELHETIAPQQQSLNDRLKEEKQELAHKLKDTPIRDLRKAVGVNDRFRFVKELFRDDEAMYERSIKTINGFHILPEAEYWMSRELKVKLGWDDHSEVVQAFYQLVKRRFS